MNSCKIQIRNIFIYENNLLNYKLSEQFRCKRNKTFRIEVSINIPIFSCKVADWNRVATIPQTRRFHGGEKTAGSIESRGNRVWRLSRGYSRSFFSCLSFAPCHLSSPSVKDFAPQ